MAEDTHGMGIPLPADSTPIHKYPGVARAMGEKIAEILAGSLPQGMLDAIGDAVGPAIENELATTDVLRGAGKTYAESIAFAIVDAAGRRSWLEANAEGGPTSHALEQIFAGQTMPESIAETSGYTFAVTDAAGRVSELALNGAGQITGAFPARMAGIAAAAAGALILPGTPIAAFGDSLTEGGWPAALAAETGITVRNYGIGGQGLDSIAARQGGVPALATLPEDKIPASGSVTLTSITASPYTYAYNTGTSSGHGTLAGVPGTLSRNNPTGVHTFTRDQSGGSVWCPPKTPWIADQGAEHRDKLQILFAARNSVLFTDPAVLVDRYRKMAAHMTSPVPRFLVVEIPPQVGEEYGTPNRAKLDTFNDLLRSEFPNQFVPVAQYLRGPALAAAGITATNQDKTDIGNGITPVSLRSDGLHWNAAAHVVVGKYLAAVLREKGWI